LIALDVDLFFDSPIPTYKIFSRWTKNTISINFDVEYLCLKIRDQANIVLLSRYDLWQNEIIKERINPACYNYYVFARNKDEFEMFNDNMHPYVIVSNIHKIWGEQYRGIIEYTDWTDAFNSLREEISFTEVVRSPGDVE
jgi:hypothetical protein